MLTLNNATTRIDRLPKDACPFAEQSLGCKAVFEDLRAEIAGREYQIMSESGPDYSFELDLTGSSGSSWGYYPVECFRLEHFAPGVYQMKLSGRVAVRSIHEEGSPWATISVNQEVETTVVPSDDSPVQLITDVEVGQSLHDSFNWRVFAGSYDSAETHGVLTWVRAVPSRENVPRLDLAFDVYLVSNGREWLAMWYTEHAKRPGASMSSTNPPGKYDDFTAERVDLVLRPNQSLAEQESMDAIWGEEIVFHDLPVDRSVADWGAVIGRVQEEIRRERDGRRPQSSPR